MCLRPAAPAAVREATRADLEVEEAGGVIDRIGRSALTAESLHACQVLRRERAPCFPVRYAPRHHQLVAAAAITLDPATVEYLEELYQPLENLLSIGFS